LKNQIKLILNCSLNILYLEDLLTMKKAIPKNGKVLSRISKAQFIKFMLKLSKRLVKLFKLKPIL